MLRLTLCLLPFALCGCLIIGDRDAGTPVPNTDKPCTPNGKPCDGCCAGATCVEMTTWQQCGVGGNACEECASGTLCRAFEGCSVDPASRWRVQPRAALLDDTNRGQPWDDDGSPPDVFASLWCPESVSSETSRTPPVPNTVRPFFAAATPSCVMTADDLMKRGFGIALFDDDDGQAQVIVEKSQIRPDWNSFDRGVVIATPTSGPLQQLDVTLEKQ